MTKPFTIHTTSPNDTQQIAHRLGQLLQEKFIALGQQTDGPLALLALSGELGAGKTTFAQGLAIGLTVAQTVTSPTFTLVNEYETTTGLRLIHIDSYRLGDLNTGIEDATDDFTDIAMDAATFGLEEILETDDAVIVIEWAERLAKLLPADRLNIGLSYAAEGPNSSCDCTVDLPESEATRALIFHATGPQSTDLLEKLRLACAL